MKKIVVLILTGFLLFGCSSPSGSGTSGKEKIDVSTLNILDFNIQDADMSGYSLLTDSQHVYKAITMEDSLRLFEEKGSGVVYYGYANCQFCQQAAPVLNNAARDMGVDIYYVDVSAQDDNREANVNSLMVHIEEFLLEEEGEPVFYVPQVFVIKDGVIVGDHLSLTESYDISTGKDMDDAEKKELKKIYIDMMDKLR